MRAGKARSTDGRAPKTTGKPEGKAPNKEGDIVAEYPDFITSCGYGYVDGILGANCRHHFTPFVEGVMEPTYTQDQLDAMKGETHKITYEGKEYDGYSSTQQQRNLERTIRYWKRRKTGAEAAGLEDKATAINARLRRLNKEYKAFSKAAGLKTQPERLKVLYADDE